MPGPPSEREHVYVLATDSMRIFDERYGQQLVADQIRLRAQLQREHRQLAGRVRATGSRVYEFLGCPREPSRVVGPGAREPRHLIGLVAALAPMPVFLHVDATPRRRLRGDARGTFPTPFASCRGSDRVGVVRLAEAELSGYRAAPPRPTPTTSCCVRARTTRSPAPTRSVGSSPAMPDALAGGLHLAIKTGDRWAATTGSCGATPAHSRREWSPIPRPWPKGLRPAGGSQLKILARHHASD